MKLKCIFAVCALLPILAGCGNDRIEDTTRLLEAASERIDELETTLQAERDVYGDRFAEFSAKQRASIDDFKELNERLLKMQRDVHELRQSSMALHGYLTVLQQRLDQIKEEEYAAEQRREKD